MQSRLSPLLAAMMILAGGCGTETGPKARPDPNRPVPGNPQGGAAQIEVKPKPVDPLTSFKDVVERPRAVLDGKILVWWNSDSMDWTKARIHVAELKFDLTKTDSLVSPVAGLITFDLPVSLIGKAPTKEEAERISGPDGDPGTQPPNWRLRYAFQGGQWTATTIERRHVVKTRMFDGEKTLLDTGWVRPVAGSDAELLLPLIEGAARQP